MGTRLLPLNMQELYAHALVVEREATKRFAELERYMRDAGMDHIADEFESIGKEEREQYELLAIGTAGRDMPQLSPWEYAPHVLGPQANVVRAPKSVREALQLAIASERSAARRFAAVVLEHYAAQAFRLRELRDVDVVQAAAEHVRV